jgi:hypothetical protein
MLQLYEGVWKDARFTWNNADDYYAAAERSQPIVDSARISPVSTVLTDPSLM